METKLHHDILKVPITNVKGYLPFVLLFSAYQIVGPRISLLKKKKDPLTHIAQRSTI